MKPPTLKDVARRAGVSASGVSAVLNNGNTGTRVCADTRQRILKAAAELRYHPNANAQGLRRKRVYCLSVLFDYAQAEIPPVSSPYAGAFLEGVLRVGQDRGYNLLLYSRTWESAESSAPMFRSQQTDGVIVAAPVVNSDTVSGLHSLGIPLVVASGSTPLQEIPQSLVDNAPGARLAAEHLMALGHRRIAHLPSLEGNDDGRVRQEAFWSTIATRGGERRPEYSVCGAELHAHPAREIERLLRLPEPPTAIFAWNDIMARMVLEVAHRLGIAVPRELSVMGFDDLPSGDDARVPLTTIRQPVRALGEAASHQLIDLIETGKCATHRILLPVSLVVRGSTSPPS